MADPIRLIIRASQTAGTDAPTVDDLLGQIRDFVDVLRGVERALDADGVRIIWRVTNATRNSPICFELTPYSTDHAAFVDDRAARVEMATSQGLLALQRGIERPPYFTDEVLPKARKLHERVTNGLADTRIDFGAASNSAPITIDQKAAAIVIEAAAATQGRPLHPYRELGSLEGYFARAELDGYGRPVLWVRGRVDNLMVKAVVNGKAIRQLEQTRLGEVWRGARLRVYGTIHYRAVGLLDHIDADFLEVVEEVGLPGLGDIVDEDFTGGLSTEDFLREVRDE